MERRSWEVEDGCWGVDQSKTRVILEKAREWGFVVLDWAAKGLSVVLWAGNVEWAWVVQQ